MWDGSGKIRVGEEGSKEEDRHGDICYWHNAIRGGGMKVRSVAKEKACSISEDLTFATDNIDVTLCLTGKKEVWVPTFKIKGGVGSIGGCSCRAEGVHNG